MFPFDFFSYRYPCKALGGGGLLGQWVLPKSVLGNLGLAWTTHTCSGCSGGPQFGHDDVEDGDEEEGVGGEEEEDRHDVDPFGARLLDEGTTTLARYSNLITQNKEIKFFSGKSEISW